MQARVQFDKSKTQNNLEANNYGKNYKKIIFSNELNFLFLFCLFFRKMQVPHSRLTLGLSHKNPNRTKNQRGFTAKPNVFNL